MNITADISLYPLADNFTPGITDFILRLRREPGLEIVTNPLSTQVRGDFAAVTAGLSHCMERSMEAGKPMVFVIKYINADLPIGTLPRIDAGSR